MNNRDLTGQKIGRWTIIEKVVLPKGQDKAMWIGRCECGVVKNVRDGELRSGKTKSCGCLRKDPAQKTKHGYAGTKIYNVWIGMVKRCGNPDCGSYGYYGGRGITVCERWLKFENFNEDMSPRPDGMSLDRVDNSKGYSKENCRWATRTQQSRNTRAVRLIAYNGETKCVSEWAEYLGLKYCTLLRRLNSGWDIARAFNTPTTSVKKEMKP